MTVAHLPPWLRAPLERFLGSALPMEEWTHRMHLTVATAMWLCHGEAGETMMGEGIQNLNRMHGVEQTTTRGFHVTLTLVWYRLVAAEILRQGLDQEPSSRPRLEAVLAALASRDLPLRYYRRETLQSWKARSEWVPPDFPEPF